MLPAETHLGDIAPLTPLCLPRDLLLIEEPAPFVVLLLLFLSSSEVESLLLVRALHWACYSSVYPHHMLHKVLLSLCCETFEMLSRRRKLLLRLPIFVAKGDPVLLVPLLDVEGFRLPESTMRFDSEEADVVPLAADKQSCNAILAFLEGEKFSCKVDTPSAILLLAAGPLASLLEEVLVGLVPIGDGVAQHHAGTVEKPRSIFLAFEVTVGLVKRWILPCFFATQVMPLCFLLPCFGVPDIARTAHPLAENLLLRGGRRSLKFDST